MQVRDVMTSALVAISPQTLAVHARAELSGRGIRHLLVTEGDRLVGIITDRDIRYGVLAAAGRLTAWDLWEADDHLARLTVGTVMSRELVTIDPNRGLHEAARSMVERKIGALPVLSGERLIGIVTDTDLLRALGVRGFEPPAAPGSAAVQ